MTMHEDLSELRKQVSELRGVEERWLALLTDVAAGWRKELRLVQDAIGYMRKRVDDLAEGHGMLRTYTRDVAEAAAAAPTISPSYNEGFREGMAAGVGTVCDRWPGINATAEQVGALVRAARWAHGELLGKHAVSPAFCADSLHDALKPFDGVE